MQRTVVLVVDKVINAGGLGRFTVPRGTDRTRGSAIIAADLDGDDDLEVVAGPTAYHHDGTP